MLKQQAVVAGERVLNRMDRSGGASALWQR